MPVVRPTCNCSVLTCNLPRTRAIEKKNVSERCVSKTRVHRVHGTRSRTVFTLSVILHAHTILRILTVCIVLYTICIQKPTLGTQRILYSGSNKGKPRVQGTVGRGTRRTTRHAHDVKTLGRMGLNRKRRGRPREDSLRVRVRYIGRYTMRVCVCACALCSGDCRRRPGVTSAILFSLRDRRPLCVRTYNIIIAVVCLKRPLIV